MSTISDALKKKRGEEDEPSKETSAPRIVEVHVPKDHSARNTLLATVLGVLVLCAAIAGGYVLLGKMGATDRRAPARPAPPATAVTPATTVTPASEVPATHVETPATGAEAPALPKLQGIMGNRFDPSAIINGRKVKLGDTIDGYKLMAVEEDRVVVERDGTRHELYLQ